MKARVEAFSVIMKTDGVVGMGSGQVAADTITIVAASTGTGITMTMVITLSNQQPATTPSSSRGGEGREEK